MFSVHTKLEEFENATITDHFVFMFENDSQGSHVIIVTFMKIFVFPSTLKRKASVFKFLRFGECFRNASFFGRISVDGRSHRRNKAAFSNSSGVVWDVALLKELRYV